MDTPSVRKTYKYRLSPTPAQAQALETVLWRCCTLYNLALEERKTAWERSGVSLTYYDLANELPDLKQRCPLAKSINDAGWRQFLTILTFKAASAGKRVVAVESAYTSQSCSGCQYMVWKGLSVRWHACPVCGLSLHRDHNSARDILRLGLEQLHGVAAVQSRAGYSPSGANVAH